MNRNPRSSLLAGAAIVLVVGVGAAGALAANGVLSPKAESEAVIDDAASQLGVEPAELSKALKQALKNRIDAAVEAGRLTEAQASELKGRIDSSEFPLFGHGGMRGPGLHGPGMRLGHGEVLAAAASYLGLTEAELREELSDKTLAEISKDRGKSVPGLVQSMVRAAEKEIDEAVAAGRLTKEQADAIKADLEERILSRVNGELPRPELGPGHRHWFGGGPGSHRGLPFSDNPSA